MASLNPGCVLGVGYSPKHFFLCCLYMCMHIERVSLERSVHVSRPYKGVVCVYSSIKTSF